MKALVKELLILVENVYLDESETYISEEDFRKICYNWNLGEVEVDMFKKELHKSGYEIN